MPHQFMRIEQRKEICALPRALDLNGQTFGNLRVIKKAPSKKGNTYWTCECLLCGSIKDYQTGHLTSGASTSCGCQRHKNFNLSTNIVQKCCPICNKTFSTNTLNRIYCYECSPKQINGSADYQRIKKRTIKHNLIQYKGGKCQRCGYDKCEGALQFHHRDPAEKEFTLSSTNISKEITMEKLYAEVDKCDLLCANCHAEIHYSE